MMRKSRTDANELRRAPTEYELQVYSADVFRSFGCPEVVGFHVPNEGKHKWPFRAKLKRMGLLPGVSDWIFFLPGGRYVCVELKTIKGYQSHTQREFQRAVEAIGGTYTIARSCKEIDDVFELYGVISKPAAVAGGGRGAAATKGTAPRHTLKVAA